MESIVIQGMKKLLFATLAGGFCMWVTAGLWHNLILPQINKEIQPHHDGLGLMLIAYLILSGLMTYLYSLLKNGNKHVMDGIGLGVIIGILWVFPHGLAMAGAHDTSVGYEIKNAIWHMVEQGIGGAIIAPLHGEKSVQ